MSLAFSVEYDGSLDGVRDHIIEVADVRERNLYVLVDTHDRTRSAREVGEDLIRHWKDGDNSKGEIQTMKLSMGLYEFIGDVRPVIPLGRVAEFQHETAKEEVELVKMEAELVKKEAELVKMEASRKSTQAVQIWQELFNRFHLRK